MEISLDIDDDLLTAARRRATEENVTLVQLVEDALRTQLSEVAPPEPYVFRFPVVDGGPPLVDVADRDALYDLLDGRE